MADDELLNVAFHDGYVAAQDGARLDDNPYHPRSTLYEEWADGWKEYHYS